MNFIKVILGKFGAGILYGAGFVVGMGALGAIAVPYFESEFESDIDEYESSYFVEYDDTAKLEAAVTSENISNGEFTLLGKLTNNGKETWSSINLKAELYDETGNFIEECTEYIRQTSRPGSGINFKLSCGSQCSSLQMERYSSYKLLIVDAHHKR